MADVAGAERALRLQIEALQFQRNKAQDEVVDLYAHKQLLGLKVEEQAIEIVRLQQENAQMKARLAELEPPSEESAAADAVVDDSAHRQRVGKRVQKLFENEPAAVLPPV